MMKVPMWTKKGICIATLLISLGVCILFFCFGISSICHSVNCCKAIKISEKEYFVLTKDNINDKGDFKYRKKILAHKDVDEIPPFTFCGNYYLEKIEFYGKVQIHEVAFFGCTNLKEVVFHNDIVSIGENAFAECKKLTTITLANGVTKISDGTFNNCKALEKIDLPDSVKSIGETAFKDCKSLAAITIPKSVTSIGENAFDGCKKLTTINYAGTKDDWNKSFDENTTNWKKDVPAQGVTCSDGNTYAWDTTDSNKLGDPL